LIHYLLFKIISLIIILLIIVIKEIIIKYYSDYKVCMCAIGKLENKYIIELMSIIKNMELIK